MTETPETPVDYGTARFVTSAHFLRIDNPRGGRVHDIYGPGKPIPQGAMTETQINHYLAHGLIERADAHGNIDRYRVDECLSAIIACIADEEGSEKWGRPRIAAALRSAKPPFAFSNKTLGLAIHRWHNPPKAD